MSKKRQIAIAVLTLFSIGLVAGLSYVAFMRHQMNDTLSKTKTTAIQPKISATQNAQSNAENILLIGSDSRYNHNGDGNPDKESSANSDTMMIAHISADKQHTTVVSIPRDTLISNPPTCNNWSPKTREVYNTIHSVSDTSLWQANAAYSIGGPQCAVKLAQRISGLTITRYVEVDFNEFKDIINTVGGVKLNICKPMIDGNIGTIFANPGVYNVDGNTALKFARAREVQGDNASDLARIKRQQDLIKQVIKQKITPSLFLNPSETSSLLNAFSKNAYTDNVDTNFLIDMGTHLNQKNIVFLSLPTQPYQPNPNRLVPDMEPANFLWSQLQQDKFVTKNELSQKISQKSATTTLTMTSSASNTSSSSISSTSSTTTESAEKCDFGG